MMSITSSRTPPRSPAFWVQATSRSRFRKKRLRACLRRCRRSPVRAQARHQRRLRDRRFGQGAGRAVRKLQRDRRGTRFRQGHWVEVGVSIFAAQPQWNSISNRSNWRNELFSPPGERPRRVLVALSLRYLRAGCRSTAAVLESGFPRFAPGACGGRSPLRSLARPFQRDCLGGVQTRTMKTSPGTMSAQARFATREEARCWPGALMSPCAPTSCAFAVLFHLTSRTKGLRPPSSAQHGPSGEA